MVIYSSLSSCCHQHQFYQLVELLLVELQLLEVSGCTSQVLLLRCFFQACWSVILCQISVLFSVALSPCETLDRSEVRTCTLILAT